MVSVRISTNDGMDQNKRLVQKLNHLLPEEYWKLYKKNVVGITPRKSSALRRSIAHSVIGNQLTIWWRSKYAAAQNAGGHTVPSMVRGINPNTGKGSTIMPGYYRYRQYTTAGTGAGFKEKATEMTQAQFMAEFYKNHPEYR